MTQKIVLLDFAGTLIKADMIEKANAFRADMLKKALPTTELHQDPEYFYKINREFVEKLTSISTDAKVRYRKNDLGFMQLSGKELQNQISTNLFQIGMYMVAKEYGNNLFPDGLIDQLKRIKHLGFKLAIISGVRTDIISGMLQIAKCPIEFDHLYGQPPILGERNQEADLKDLEDKGTINFITGDKACDLQRAKSKETKTIFVNWGHASGGEEKLADFTITHPDELKEIIK